MIRIKFCFSYNQTLNRNDSEMHSVTKIGQDEWLPVEISTYLPCCKACYPCGTKTMSAICCFSPLVRQLSGAFLGSQVISIYRNNFINSLGKILLDLPLSPNSSFSPHLPTFWGPPQWLGDLCSVECQHLHLLGLQWYSCRQLHIYLCSVMCRFAISVLITEAPLWGRAGDSWGGKSDYPTWR